MPISQELLLQAYGFQLVADLPSVVHYNQSTSQLETQADEVTIRQYADEYRQNEFVAYFHPQAGNHPRTKEEESAFLQRLNDELDAYIDIDDTIPKDKIRHFIHKKQQTQTQGGILDHSKHLHKNIRAVQEGSKVMDPSRSMSDYERFLAAMQMFQLTMKDLLKEPDIDVQTVSDGLCLLKGLEIAKQEEA